MRIRWLALLLLALGCLHVAAAWHGRGMACDDAYITFRYAENLQNGHGLRWNPDSQPCEGYTNLTYVLLLAGLGKLGIDPVDGAAGIAAVAMLGLVLLLIARTRRAGRWQFVALAPALLLFGSDDLRVHASRGLETCLFGALAAAQVVAAARLLQQPIARRSAWPAAALGTALFLTRPDGVLVSACCWAGILWLARHERTRCQSIWSGVRIWLASGLLYAAWKLWVFGYLLPNSFYMKNGAGGFAGIAETAAFLQQYWPLLAMAAVGALLALTTRTRSLPVPRDGTAVLALLIAVPWLLYGSKIVHEIGFAHRFCWPLVPILAVGACSTSAQWLATHGLGKGTLTLAMAGLVGVLWWIAPAQIAAGRDLQAAPQLDPYVQTFLRLGKAIDSAAIEGLNLYCTHAGATPYAARAHHIDPAGLVDDGYCRRTAPEERARYEANLRWDIVSWHLFPATVGATTFASDPRATSSRYLREWVLGLDPDMDAVLRASHAGSSLEQRQAQLFLFMCILRDFATLVGEMDTGMRRWRTFVYVWKASPHHDRLVEHLGRKVDIPASRIDFDGWPAK